MTSKQERQILRAKRRGLPPEIQQIAAQRVAYRLLHEDFFRTAQRVAYYWKSDGELDPNILRERCSDSSKLWFLPRLAQDYSKTMTFAEIGSQTPLVANCFGIPEPAMGRSRSEPASSMAVILLPLVGFDRSGNRLGMGGGYYDRMLAGVPTAKAGGPVLVGLAHDCQECREIAAQPWDIKLNMIVTDSELICVRPR